MNWLNIGYVACLLHISICEEAGCYELSHAPCGSVALSVFLRVRSVSQATVLAAVVIKKALCRAPRCHIGSAQCF